MTKPQFIHPTTCKIANCPGKYYAKGYCRIHYAGIITRGGYMNRTHRKCSVDECKTFATINTDLCAFHLGRIHQGVPLHLPRRPWKIIDKFSKKNPNVSRQRLWQLRKAQQGLCSTCGKKIYKGNYCKYHCEQNLLNSTVNKCKQITTTKGGVKMDKVKLVLRVAQEIQRLEKKLAEQRRRFDVLTTTNVAPKKTKKIVYKPKKLRNTTAYRTPEFRQRMSIIAKTYWARNAAIKTAAVPVPVPDNGQPA